MNRTALKNYAPLARRAFIQAITDRAAYYGLTANKIEPIVQRGDVAVIGGREYPRAVAGTRKQLEERIKRHGFGPTMEAIAYTWFNRLVAIRFMELHGYLEHGYRVLSHPEGKTAPEILEQAEHVALGGLNRDVVIGLKVAGNKDGELYRLLLTAQCNALHAAMPFLFERIDDETELLLPDNLLHSDSLIRKLVSEIDEQDWLEVEIIGWLYQFYISEKKEEVIGKVVASEDIPAATQLFTPNWIVKYMVQNTLGRQWLATYPQSALRRQMEFYVEPAKQPPEVQEKLKEITPASLNPEELTLLDPACGSGHILVEAYDLFKGIYQERGYRAKDIPALILQKNLFGLEIDDRAAQLASFALMMKARADDRRIFDSDAKPNILAFEDSREMNATDISRALNSPINKDDIPSEYLLDDIREDRGGLFSKKALTEKGHVSEADIASLLELFEGAKTFGSLIRVPPRLAAKLSEIENRLEKVLEHGDLTHATAHVLKPFIQQARSLSRQYDAVVANPPYLNKKNMTLALKSFAEKSFPATKTDLFEMFIIRWLGHDYPPQHLAIVCPFTWMFLSSYSAVRQSVIGRSHVQSLIQLEYNAFEPACVPVSTFVLSTKLSVGYRGDFIRLSDFPTPEQQPIRTREAITNPDCGWRFSSCSEDFQKVPGELLAYWLTPEESRLFKSCPPLSERAAPRQGLITGDNDLFLRLWYEVSLDNSALLPLSRTAEERKGRRWFPYQKGGPYRKWYGNHYFVVNWENDGQAIRNFVDERGKLRSRPQNIHHFFQSGATWSSLTSGSFAFRYVPDGFIFADKGPMCFPFNPMDLSATIALGNLPITNRLLMALAPTLDYAMGPVGSIPFITRSDETLDRYVSQAIKLAKVDWDECETSWEFPGSPLLAKEIKGERLRQSIESLLKARKYRKQELLGIENDINSLVHSFLALHDEPPVSLNQITLSEGNAIDAVKNLISYSIGCMMGRYSLDEPGLIFAHSDHRSFDLSRYRTFRADEDGIISLLENDWGISNDGASRCVDFIGEVWPKDYLEENLQFIADTLGRSADEQPRNAIRRYLATTFYKDHLQNYKGPKHPPRPIYWLFSSGKLRAFQCLVYLHRYQEGTLARMRTEYVIPLQGQIAARIEQLEGDKATATSTSHRNKLQKEQTSLKKQQAELLIFEENLKHVADKRIKLDLDEGVRVNYAKFGDLLAESKVIAGGSDGE